MTAWPETLLSRGGGECLLDERLDVLERLVRRTADEKTCAAELPVRRGDARCLVRRLDARRDRRAARCSVEQRQRVDAEAEDGHAERLEQLRRRGHVEQRLHARRDDERRRAGELAEVGRDVGRVREAAVHAADSARRHEADPHGAGDRERAADRRRGDRALRRGGAEIARPRPCGRRRRTARAPPRSVRRRTSPSSTPTVAGTAPAARTCASDSSPTATPSPGGKPCATSVVSSATTAPPPASASRTSAARRIMRRVPSRRSGSLRPRATSRKPALRYARSARSFHRATQSRNLRGRHSRRA